MFAPAQVVPGNTTILFLQIQNSLFDIPKNFETGSAACNVAIFWQLKIKQPRR